MHRPIPHQGCEQKTKNTICADTLQRESLAENFLFVHTKENSL